MSKAKGKAKNAKGKDAAAAAASSPVVPTDEWSTLSVAALKEALARVEGDYDGAVRRRNTAQQSFLKLTENFTAVQAEVVRGESHINNILTAIERIADTHRADIAVYQQKVSHLNYEHQHNKQQTQLQRTAAADQLIAVGKEAESVRAAERQALSERIATREAANVDDISRLSESHRKEISKLRETFERQCADQLTFYTDRLTAVAEEMRIKTQMELHEIDERKNAHLAFLKNAHEKAFLDIRHYYQSITSDNVSLITSLQAEIETLRTNQIRAETERSAMAVRLNVLGHPMSVISGKVTKLRAALISYDKDVLAYNRVRRRRQTLTQRFQHALSEQKRIEDELQQLGSKKETLSSQFLPFKQNMNEQVLLYNLPLNKRAKELSDLFAIKKAQFTSVLKASKVEPTVLKAVTSQLEAVIAAKNQQLTVLTDETNKLRKVTNDYIRFADEKLAQSGVPKYGALANQTMMTASGQPIVLDTTISLAPAGLITQ